MAPARKFGHSWWGKAWLASLEASQFADDGRLSRGRTYARQDRVQDVSVLPGSIQSKVWGTETYSTSLAVKQLDDEQWNVLIDLIMSRARYSAELLAGAMPQGLAADAEEAGTPLLPVVGDLTPDCSCPDWGDPCKHAAALCYLTCDLIDDDPFVLFFVRGRDRASIVEEVRRRRAALAGTTNTEPSGSSNDDTTDPVAAFGRKLRALPAARPMPTEPGSANPLRIGAPADSGLDNRELEELANDAARRALGVLVGEEGTSLRVSEQVDLVRRAANELDQGRSLDRFVPHFVGTIELLEVGARAWVLGGDAAVAAAVDVWPATVDQLAAAKTVLGSKARKSDNAMHAGSVQLRLDRIGQWWRFYRDDRLGWVMAAGPFDAAADAAR